MRSLLYKLCQEKNYNLTTSYGLKNECQTIPFSCNKGKNLYFIYGHDRDIFINNKPQTLKITMLRDPLSWLISRIQHEMRKNKNINSQLTFSEAIINFGTKYFNFLNDNLRIHVIRMFNRLVKLTSTDSSYSLLNSKLTKNSFNLSYTLLLNEIESQFQNEIFVLQNSYYPESLQMLSLIFNASFISGGDGKNQKLDSIATTNKDEVVHLNEAEKKQDQSSMGTLADLKKLNMLLEIHNEIYYISLREFKRQQEYLLDITD